MPPNRPSFPTFLFGLFAGVGLVLSIMDQGFDALVLELILFRLYFGLFISRFPWVPYGKFLYVYLTCLVESRAVEWPLYVVFLVRPFLWDLLGCAGQYGLGLVRIIGKIRAGVWGFCPCRVLVRVILSRFSSLINTMISCQGLSRHSWEVVIFLERPWGIEPWVCFRPWSHFDMVEQDTQAAQERFNIGFYVFSFGYPMFGSPFLYGTSFYTCFCRLVPCSTALYKNTLQLRLMVIFYSCAFHFLFCATALLYTALHYLSRVEVRLLRLHQVCSVLYCCVSEFGFSLLVFYSFHVFFVHFSSQAFMFPAQ